MLISIAYILLVGMFMGWLCSKIKLPSLLGMIITGIVLGPYVLNLIDDSILGISADLRKIALIIILTRAGLTLNINDLKKVGRSAILMCFLPATFEIIGMVLLAPKLLSVSVLEAAVIGAVVAAVSPAVIVPKMIKLTEEGYGTKKGIPQMILAGASVDDVYVIVLFAAFTGLLQGEKVSVMSFVNIPISICLGIIIGILLGYVLAKFFKKFHIRDTAKVIIVLCLSFILVTAEDKITGVITFSALISIMFVGVSLQKYRSEVAKRLSVKFNKLWVCAEVILFVLVGATVDIHYVSKAGIAAVILIFGVLCFRVLGVFLCMLKTDLSMKERVFCMIAYTPKATVQAAIGGVPLAMGLSCGNIVLTVAVLAILITATLGAFLIDVTYKKLLCKE
ncbi:cation:proton antiporter [Clostridium sp. MSJ-8]|uniref:cation:proton antiporter domain-containing protein n=1 Tax=Clostridium sp. MSJ-8 TaxID=2841510 RepID=UPI001C0EFB1F|nr:cation:proton antiporter [Clostridium sp. MSJ-8]MBU5488857.1 cation:proton antiporter [Clostridium sp. MSJ-8]